MTGSSKSGAAVLWALTLVLPGCALEWPEDLLAAGLLVDGGEGPGEGGAGADSGRPPGDGADAAAARDLAADGARDLGADGARDLAGVDLVRSADLRSRDGAADAGRDAAPPDLARPGCVPAPEVCDGRDNDCDGQVDEGVKRPCYTGPGGTQGRGPCRAGVQTCRAGAWGACDGQVLPAAEVCDGRDNDCDGVVDDGVVASFYRDADGDGYGDAKAPAVRACQRPVGYVARSGDCDDAHADVKPGQTLYFTTPVPGTRSFDYDCDGRDEPQAALAIDCARIAPEACRAAAPSGWSGPVPRCGDFGLWSRCTFMAPRCGAVVEPRRQACR